MTKAHTDQHHLVIGFALVLLGALGFAAKAILIKLAYSASVQVDAITLMALRMLFHCVFSNSCRLGQKKIERLTVRKKTMGVVAVLGLMGYYIASYLDFIGLQYISAGLERVILFLYPTFVVLFSALVHKRKITLRWVWR